MLANQTVGISRVTRPRGNRCFRRLLLSMAIIFHVTALSLGCSCPIPLFSYVHASRDATTSPFNNSVRRRRVTTTFSLLFLDFRTSCLVLLFIFFFWLRFFSKIDSGEIVKGRILSLGKHQWQVQSNFKIRKDGLEFARFTS